MAAFWDMTPAELFIEVDGFFERQQEEWERAAFVAASIINGTTIRNEPVTIDQLLGRVDPQDVAPKETTKEDYEAMKARFEGVNI